MAENMTIHVEVWPLAADPKGIWLISGPDGWRDTCPVIAGGHPHADVELLLFRNGITSNMIDLQLLHSTSWRVGEWGLYLTYVAVIHCDGYVRAQWPGAEPVALELPDAVGKPTPHAPTEPPNPRNVDVLLHTIRSHAVKHLRYQLDTNSTNADALDDNWHRHLQAWPPALAGMYIDGQIA